MNVFHVVQICCFLRSIVTLDHRAKDPLTPPSPTSTFLKSFFSLVDILKTRMQCTQSSIYSLLKKKIYSPKKPAV